MTPAIIRIIILKWRRRSSELLYKNDVVGHSRRQVSYIFLIAMAATGSKEDNNYIGLHDHDRLDNYNEYTCS